MLSETTKKEIRRNMLEVFKFIKGDFSTDLRENLKHAENKPDDICNTLSLISQGVLAVDKLDALIELFN